MFLITLISILSQTTDATTSTGATQTTPQTTTTNEATTNTTPQTTTASCQEPQLCDCVAAETIELGTVTQGSLNEDSPIFPRRTVKNPEPGQPPLVPVCGTDDNTGAIVKIEPNGRVAWFNVIGTGEEITASTCSNNSGGSATFDTELSVFNTCQGGLGTGSVGFDPNVCVAGNGDTALCASSSGSFASTVTWLSVLGQEYKILVHAFEGDVGTQGGLFNLALFSTPKPTTTGATQTTTTDATAITTTQGSVCPGPGDGSADLGEACCTGQDCPAQCLVNPNDCGFSESK